MMLLSFALASAGPAYELLRQRDPVTCGDLGEATPGLRDELIGLTDPEIRPVLVHIRAANCLSERFSADPVVQGRFAGWMTSSETAGLALAVLHRAGDMAPEVARDLVGRAALSPNARVRATAMQLALTLPEPAAPTP